MLTNAVCTICTDVYETEKPVAAMPCGHTFHDECLETWLKTARNCPTCRKPLKKSERHIHRLFFSIDNNLSQFASSSPKTKDPFLLEQNRKLQVQVTALSSAITKLKSECQSEQDGKAALLCALSDKNTEIQSMSKVHDKLKRRLREYSGRDNELEVVKKQLEHLRHVQTIVEGVDADVKHMLAEKVGYTAQQLTYVMLLRRQLDTSKQSTEKLRREFTECREKLVSSERKNRTSEDEIELLKLELKQAEVRNISLKKKCDMLIKSMDSPRGVANSLANRIVNQSPFPEFITPPPVADSTNRNKRTVSVTDLCTPMEGRSTSKLECEGSPDLFGESLGLEFSDAEGDNVKMVLDFQDDDGQDEYRKKRRLLGSKDALTQGKVENSPASPNYDLKIKPKSMLKVKSRLKPIRPIAAHSSHVRDVTNLPITGPSKRGERPSQYFRNGFDGFGGQAQTFSRMQSAMQFNVFRKPAVTKSKASRAPVPASASASQPTVDKYIVLDSESD